MSVTLRRSYGPNANKQLGPHEIQLEGTCGAVSVCENFKTPNGLALTVTVTTVRGIYGRKAQIAELNLEELEALISILTEAKNELVRFGGNSG